MSDQNTASIPKHLRSTNPVIERVIQEEVSQPPIIETSGPQIRPITDSPPGDEYDYAEFEQEISMSVFDAENQI